jgi:adenine-specific DNA-methyltransferase
MSSSIKNTIIEVLKRDDRLWDKTKTEYNMVLLFDLIEKFDETLITLLYDHELIREKFFLKIKNTMIFDINKFKFFIEENKINNSYTSFENIIALSTDDELLRNNADVVLNFPFKDCILNGGQTTEEGSEEFFEFSNKNNEKKLKSNINNNSIEYSFKKSKRDEVFFNEVLAADEIDRLKDEKAFTNWKRYNSENISEVGKIKRNKNGVIDENLIIKGNNLIALYSLESQYTNQIKMIYIDPPYYFSSTTKSNDSFVYNSNFKLSTWLTFMKSRLEVAQRLLKDDGLIFISIDDGGQAYLKVLMDEIFGIDNFISTIPTIMNLKGNNDEFGFSGTHEYTLVYAKNKKNAIVKEFPLDEEELLAKWDEDEIGYYKKGATLKRTGTDAPRSKRPYAYYPILVKDDKIFSIEEEEFNKIYDAKSKEFNDKFVEDLRVKYESLGYEFIIPTISGKKTTWRWQYSKVKSESYEIIISNNGETSFYKKQRPQLDEIPTKKPKSIFYKPEYSSGNGTRQIKDYFGEKVFNNPKPLELIRDFVLLATDKDDIIMDFHAGSGTTGDAVLRLGENRKFILVEQMDYIETITVERVRKALESSNNKNSSFIYFEIAELNENAKKEIIKCNNITQLKDLFEKLYNKYFLNYNLRLSEFKNITLKDERFTKLSLNQQKSIFLRMLDLNQMYINRTEIKDKKYDIKEDDQRLINDFYNGV